MSSKAFFHKIRIAQHAQNHQRLGNTVSLYKMDTACYTWFIEINLLILKVFKAYHVPILSGISVWAYGMIVMAFIWWVICKCKTDHLIDARVKGHITGAFTEFAIIASITSVVYFALLNLFIVLPLQVGVSYTVVAALALSGVFIAGGYISSRIAFGKTYKGNR